MKKAILLCLSFFLVLHSLPAQDDFQEEIKVFQKDTLRGVLKNGKPWSGIFAFEEDVFGFNDLLKKGFDPAEGRFARELVLSNGYFRKSFDIYVSTTKVEYVDGKPSGPIAFYNDAGYREPWTLVFTSNIRKGQLDGNYTSYYYDQRNGFLPFAKLSYINGKKEGEVVFYNRGGGILGKGIYKNDLPYSGQFNQSNLEFEKYEGGKKILQVQRIIPLDEDRSPGVGGELPKHPTKIYDSKKWRFVHLVKGTYRNDQPWMGQFYDAGTRQLKTYEEGRVVQQVLIKKSGWACIETNFDKEGQPTTQHFYENGNSINFQSDDLIYKGVYANGEKEDGDFFELNEQFPRLLLHSRYQSGILQKQTFLEYESYWMPSGKEELSGVYENGKIKTGMKIDTIRQLVFQKVYEDAVLKQTSVVSNRSFPKQGFAMKVQEEANGYSVLNYKGELFSRLTYSPRDSSYGSISYFAEGKELGSIDVENNKIINGDCEFPVEMFRINDDQKTIFKTRNGVRTVKRIFRDFEERFIDTLDQEIPISFHAFRTPDHFSTRRVDTYWTGTEQQVCSVFYIPGIYWRVDRGIMVMTGIGDEAFFISAYQDGEKVEDFSVRNKAELEGEVARLKLVYFMEE